MRVSRPLTSVFVGSFALSCNGLDDPFAIPPPQSCEVADQNDYVFEVMRRTYLWNDGMPQTDSNTFASPEELLAALRREDIDRWSRISDKQKSDAFFKQGMVVGLGFRSKRDAGNALRIASIYGGSPAEHAGLQRGDFIRSVNHVTVEELDSQNGWSNIYGTNEPGIVVELTVESLEGTLEDVTVTKDWITIPTVPVHWVRRVGARNIGYLAFETFVDTSNAQLDSAFSTFREQGVDDVIVDLRYNGGGRVQVAHHLVNLLVGGRADDKVAYRVAYNDDLSRQDVVQYVARTDVSVAPERIVFLTTPTTLSASELVINAVRPHATVYTVGSVTGGKPVGSLSWSFCDKILFPITFQLVNAKNEGDYFDGLATRCSAIDDFSHAIGDVEEGMLAEALHLLGEGDCSPVQAVVSPAEAFQATALPWELDELRGVR